MRLWILNSNHSQTQGPVRVKVIREGQSQAVAVSDLGLGLFVVPNLTPDVLGEDQVWALSIIKPLL